MRLVAIAFVLVLAASASAQTPRAATPDVVGPHRTLITLGLGAVDPSDALTLILFQPELERAFDRRTSWFVSGSFSPLTELFAFGAKAGIRYYFDSNAPEGFWLGPRLSFYYRERRDEGVFTSRIAFESALCFGYTWHIFDRIVLSFGFSLGFETRSVRRANGERIGESGLSPDFLRLNVGGAF